MLLKKFPALICTLTIYIESPWEALDHKLPRGQGEVGDYNAEIAASNSEIPTAMVLSYSIQPYLYTVGYLAAKADGQLIRETNSFPPMCEKERGLPKDVPFVACFSGLSSLTITMSLNRSS